MLFLCMVSAHMEQIKYINDIRIDYSGVLCMFAPMTMTCAGILVQLRSNPGRIYRYSVVQIAVTLVRREGSRRGLKSITPPLVSWYTLMNHGIWCVVCWWSLAVVHSCWSGVSKPKLSKEKKETQIAMAGTIFLPSRPWWQVMRWNGTQCVHHGGHWRHYDCRVKLEILGKACLDLLALWVYLMLVAYLFLFICLTPLCDRS